MDACEVVMWLLLGVGLLGQERTLGGTVHGFIYGRTVLRNIN